MADPIFGDIPTISEAIRSGTLSPVSIIEGCLERIEKLNPQLNAFITVAADQAMEQAMLAESEIRGGGWRGPLHGIPVAIKDFYDTAGIRTTAAVEQFKDRVPTRDALGVEKLKDAGAIIIGKTNMHELGMGTTSLASYYGPVRNPWNAEYVAGGSSGGSAAAVSSGLCYATFDTDAIGSCRLPAACCGVVGFKGTYGLINTQGILEGTGPPDEMIVWLNHAGVTTRSVVDTALMLNVLAERDGYAKTIDFAAGLAKKRQLRIGVANNVEAGPEVTAALAKAVVTIRSLGHATHDTAAPLVDPSHGLANIEADRKAIAEQAFKDVDVLMLPTTTTTVPAVEDAGSDPLALSAANTVFANYYGLPAVSIPCGFDAAGLPLGLQLVGKPRDEQAVLQLAHQYQQTERWSAKHPAL